MDELLWDGRYSTKRAAQRREVWEGFGGKPLAPSGRVLRMLSCPEHAPFTFSASVACVQMSQHDEPNLRYGEGTEKLSQLSDIVSLSQESEFPNKLQQRTQSVNCAQESLFDLVDELPSQAVLPTPELPFASQRNDTSGAAAAQSIEPDIASDISLAVNMPSGEDEQAYVPERSKSNRRATRRGPMDEMRQLVRILVKVIPQSINNIKACDESGGGNRISEDQIKYYLSSTLGDAPQPRWGVPNGWGSYLAELFSWVTGRRIDKDQAMQCAKREPGRSWEAIDSELARLGLLPSTWPLPLSKESISSALVPTAQGLVGPSSSAAQQASPKRSADSRPSSEGSGKRSRVENHANSQAADEVALWSEALRLVNAALAKSGSAATLDEQMTIAKLRSEIQSKVQVPSVVPQPALPLYLQPQAPQLVPVSMAGPDGQIQTAYTLQMQPGAQGQGTSQPFMETGSMNASQFLIGQPGSSAFQAVQSNSSIYHGSHSSVLLNGPPPLRLTSKPSLTTSDSQPSSPSTDESSEDNSGNFNPNTLSGWSAGSPASKLFKPTAVKSDPAGTAGMPPIDSVVLPFGSTATGCDASNCMASFPFMNYLTNTQLAQLAASFPATLQSSDFGRPPTDSLQQPLSGKQTGAFLDVLDKPRQMPVSAWVPPVGVAVQ